MKSIATMVKECIDCSMPLKDASATTHSCRLGSIYNFSDELFNDWLMERAVIDSQSFIDTGFNKLASRHKHKKVKKRRRMC
jgi:hypothetical protein